MLGRRAWGERLCPAGGETLALLLRSLSRDEVITGMNTAFEAILHDGMLNLFELEPGQFPASACCFPDCTDEPIAFVCSCPHPTPQPYGHHHLCERHMVQWLLK